MSDHDLRAVARDIERQVPLPDFDLVAARGHRLRRRRRIAQATAAAGAVGTVVLAAVGVARMPGPAPDTATPPTDRAAGAAEVLADPGALVDDRATAVSDTGAVLHRVHVPSADPCSPGGSAWVWTPWEGEPRSWSDRVGSRTAVAVGGGFAVGAPSRDCGGEASRRTPGAYVVDTTGARRSITWVGAAERVCATDPAAARCTVDVATATGRLREQPVREAPSASTFPVSSVEGWRWARSADSRTLYRSTDGGTTWRPQETSFPATQAVQVTAAGEWAMFFSYPEAEYTRDGGRTWQRWDGAAPLSSFVVANELVALSADGDLVVVSHRAGAGPQLLGSTDDGWRRFRTSDVSTGFGTVAPQAAGSWLWVPEQGRTWVSPDGVSWQAVDPLPD